MKNFLWIIAGLALLGIIGGLFAGSLVAETETLAVTPTCESVDLGVIVDLDIKTASFNAADIIIVTMEDRGKYVFRYDGLPHKTGDHLYKDCKGLVIREGR